MMPGGSVLSRGEPFFKRLEVFQYRNFTVYTSVYIYVYSIYTYICAIDALWVKCMLCCVAGCGKGWCDNVSSSFTGLCSA